MAYDLVMYNAIKMKHLSKLLVLIVALSACNNIGREKPTFKIVLPDTSATHQPDIFYEVKKKAAQELMLNQLENGSDSFELRLWAKVEVMPLGQVFIIKRIDNKWTCLNYNYVETAKWSPGPNMLDYAKAFSIDTFAVKKLEPKTNWKTFFNAIEKEDIYNLPSQSDIKGWKNKVSDGYTFYVEYATKYKYKFYWYNCPDVYENEFKECRQMSNILSVFSKEFGLRMGMSGTDNCRCITK